MLNHFLKVDQDIVANKVKEIFFSTIVVRNYLVSYSPRVILILLIRKKRVDTVEFFLGNIYFTAFRIFNEGNVPRKI